MPNIHFIYTHTQDPAYKEAIYRLRENVLRIPLNLSLKNEDLSKDALDTVVLALNREEPIACVMLHPLENAFKLRQMAVANEWQGKGVGKKLVAAAEEYARTEGKKEIVLHARYHARGFYDKIGYKPVGDMFTEVGIPHVKMTKEL